MGQPKGQKVGFGRVSFPFKVKYKLGLSFIEWLPKSDNVNLVWRNSQLKLSRASINQTFPLSSTSGIVFGKHVNRHPSAQGSLNPGFPQTNYPPTLFTWNLTWMCWKTMFLLQGPGPCQVPCQLGEGNDPLQLGWGMVRHVTGLRAASKCLLPGLP